jgi:hypothetical protein
MAFLRLPFELYENDPCWVAPLFFERLQHLDANKNPYFQRAEAQLFLAERQGKVVGRISAQVDSLHTSRYHDGAGQFGFLEGINDSAVFASLLNASAHWLKSKGMDWMRGPFSFSINDEAGLLVDGFETPPSTMMGHALPYYAAHVESNGYQKVRDLYAYDYPLNTCIPSLIERAYKRAMKSGDVQVRPLNKQRVDEELDIIMSIFNDAWCGNWGFIPLTEAELRIFASQLRLLVTGEFVAIASVNGVPAAMCVTLPNLNEWYRDLKGKLFPTGWIKLMARVLSKKSQSVRLVLMGVRKEYQGTTQGAALAFAVIMAVRKYHLSRGVKRVEMSWVLEDNLGMRKIIETAGATHYKTYRVYEKSLQI